MSRKRSYRPKALYEAVERYLKSCRATLPVRLDGEIVTDENGNEMTRSVYLVPPRLTQLCLELGITRATWANYCNDPAYNEATELARTSVESFLEGELAREKNVRGIIFNLQNNFGWKEKQEIEMAGETKVEVSTAAMSIEDKLRAIRQAQMEASK